MLSDSSHSRLLVIEPDRIIQRQLARCFKQRGIEYLVIPKSETVFHLDTGRLTAVIIDTAPQDLTGLALTHVLRKRHGGDLPIIVLSSEVSTRMLSSLSALGVTKYLAKPVSQRVLMECVEEFTGPHRVYEPR